MHLIIFDVDGTLTRSSGVDARCFQRAVLEVLGVRVDTNWAQYRHQTDSGILMEILERQGRERTQAVSRQVKVRFLELLREACSADPSSCVEVAGAAALLQRLGRRAQVQVAIATGAWEESARLKLDFAGIEAEQLPLASADDSPERKHILEVAIARASGNGARHVRGVTYVGDGPWDVMAAKQAALRFVGVAGGSAERSALERAGAHDILFDLTEARAFELLVGGSMGGTWHVRV